MAVEHLEIERKFDVDEGFAMPDLAGLPGVSEVREPVEHALEAAYYDTPDLRLARARVTLRRRTGGTDAGWHEKLPVTGARRDPRTRDLAVTTELGIGSYVGAPVRVAARDCWISMSAARPCTSAWSPASSASIRPSRSASFASAGRMRSSPAVAE